MRRGDRWAFAGLAVSVVLMAVSLGWLAASRGSEEVAVGQRPAATSAPSTAAPARTVPAAPEPARPVRVGIPRIDVDTRIVPVGMDASRAVEVPDDISIVGWYAPTGVEPGSDRGSAVLVAHRDGDVGGAGVFYDLGRLEPGDRVVVTDADGRRLRYEVVSREYIDRRRLPVDELFGATGPPRLTLISCGGEYVPERGGYQDNVVVTAIPS